MVRVVLRAIGARHVASDFARRGADRAASARDARAAATRHRRRTAALLRVEACGICGSDAEQYAGVIPVRMPLIPGHEPLGIIERIGDRAAKRWGVNVGDRVAVEALIRCGYCRDCLSRQLSGLPRPRRAVRARLRAASRVRRACGARTPTTCTSIRTRSCTRCRADIPASMAVMFNPLGAGFRWAVEMPDTKPGDSVLILGPGQRGLASVIAARAAGAGTIIVTGLTRDAAKLGAAPRRSAPITSSTSSRRTSRARVHEHHRRARRRRRRRGVRQRARAGGRSAALRRARRLHRARRREGLQAGARLHQRPDGGEGDHDQGRLRRDLRVVRRGDPPDRVRPRPLERMHTHDFPLEQADAGDSHARRRGAWRRRASTPA